MHERSNSFLVTQPIGSLMRHYAVSCIISLLVAALYNIVDQIFIANASYLGSYGNAANTVVFPLTVVALAIAVMIGDGCCAFVSISLGSGQTDRARKSIGSAILLSVLLGILLTACYLLFSQQILTALLSVRYLCRMKAVRLDRSCFRLHGELARRYLPLGICSFLSQISLAAAMAAFIYLQALGRPFLSTALSMIREVIFGVGLSLLLPRFFGLDGVLYSMPVSDVLTFLISAVVLVRTYRALRQGGGGMSFSAL